MSASLYSSIPPEIIDAFIDNVSMTSKEPSPILGRVDDVLTRCANRLPLLERRDLKACSLISKQWLARSRYHLFHHVTLRSHNIDADAVSLTNIAPYVQDLVLMEGRADRGEKPWLSDAFPRLAALHAAESISISHGSFQSLKDGCIATLFRNFGSLKYLQLHHCSFSSITQLAETVYSSTRLTGLTLQSVVIIPKRGPVAAVRKRFRRVSSLTISCGGMAFFAEAMDPPRAPSDLHTLDISNCTLMAAVMGWLHIGAQIIGAQAYPIETLRLNITGAPDVKAHSKFMGTIGSSLESFAVDFTTDSGQFDMQAADIFSRNIDMSLNQRLRVVDFPFVGLYSHWAPFLVDRAAHFPHLLARLSSPRIEEICMHVGIDSPRDLNRLDWAKLDKVLEQANFANLKRFVVTVSLGVSPMDTQTIGNLACMNLKRRLSACDARGRLVVEIKYVAPLAS